MRTTTSTLHRRLQSIEERIARLDSGGKRGRPLNVRARVLDLETRLEGLEKWARRFAADIARACE